jgi:hypothetical protein
MKAKRHTILRWKLDGRFQFEKLNRPKVCNTVVIADVRE